MTIPAPALMEPRFHAFTSWYPGQAETWSKIMEWASSPDTEANRFWSLVAPAGCGKSLIEMLVSSLSQRRTAILTHTKALQNQLRLDFANVSRDHLAKLLSSSARSSNHSPG